MSLVLCNAQKVQLLNQKLTKLNTLSMGLTTSSHTPAGTDNYATWSGTTPVDTGYSAFSFATNNFGSSVVSGTSAQTTSPNYVTTFNYSGATPLTIYGAWVYDAGASLLYWGEQNSAGSFTVTAANQTYTVSPQLTEV